MAKQDRRIQLGTKRGRSFEIEVNGEKILAYEGETIAEVLLANGKRTMRRTAKIDQPRGLYCGMGICYECRMIVDGRPNVQVCQFLAKPGCKVETQYGLGRENDKICEP